MAGNEAEEITSVIVSGAGKIVSTASDLLLQLIRGLAHIGADKMRGGSGERKGLLARGRQFIANRLGGFGEQGRISQRKLLEKDGDITYTVVDREDLREMKKQLKKHGVDFSVIPRKDGKFEFLYQAKNAEIMRAAAENVALKMGVTEEEIKEAKDVEEDIGSSAVTTETQAQTTNNIDITRGYLPSAPEKMDYAKQEWNLADIDGQTTYFSFHEGLTVTACADGKYNVFDNNRNELYSGRAYGGLKSAMLDGAVCVRSFAKKDELNKGVTVKTVTKAQCEKAKQDFKNSVNEKKDKVVEQSKDFAQKTKESIKNNETVQKGVSVVSNAKDSAVNKKDDFKTFLQNKKAQQQVIKEKKLEAKNIKRNKKVKEISYTPPTHKELVKKRNEFNKNLRKQQGLKPRNKSKR